MQLSKAIVIILIFSSLIYSQERSGLMVGLNFLTTSHENPYVYFSGSETNPQNFKGFSDNTTQLYIPFGYVNYSKDSYSEVSSAALHFLVLGGINLLNPNKAYKASTNKTFTGDSYADGYIPVFSDFLDNTGALGTAESTRVIEASYSEIDLVRAVFSSRFIKQLPVMFGAQGGIGKFGVHFSWVKDGSSPTPANTDGPGVVNFNDGTDLYFGVNTGAVVELGRMQLLHFSLQYDWHYFIDGVEKAQVNGNRITLEASYFPFPDRTFWGNLFFKAFYKHNNVPYMKKFADAQPVDYSNSTFGLGIQLIIL